MDTVELFVALIFIVPMLAIGVGIPVVLISAVLAVVRGAVGVAIDERRHRARS